MNDNWIEPVDSNTNKERTQTTVCWYGLYNERQAGEEIYKGQGKKAGNIWILTCWEIRQCKL